MRARCTREYMRGEKQVRVVDVELPCQRSPRLFAVPDSVVLWRDEELSERAADRVRRERAAVQLCWECPLMRECREWALGADDQTLTVCGGMTPRELRVARRARVAA